MFTTIEKLITARNLKPKKKEGFLKIISIFSFLGIMLGVAVLIIVMSVMNGFKNDLTKKILGLNPHVVIQPNSYIINEKFINQLSKKFTNITLSKTYSGEGIVISDDKAKGLIIKGVDKNEKRTLEFLKKNLITGSIKNFQKNYVFIGTELAFNLNLNEGDKINLMSYLYLLVVVVHLLVIVWQVVTYCV